MSIGTLYQYFNDKEDILQALMQREMEGLSARMLEALERPSGFLGGRIPVIVQAVLSRQGGRRRVQRSLLTHALARATATRLNPFYAKLIELLASGDVDVPERPQITRSDAFALTHAFAGVMRALIATADRLPPQKEVEESLSKLVANFVRP